MTDASIDHKALLASLPQSERTRLTAKSDRAGLLHLAGHLALILALAGWVGLGLPYWGLVLAPLGIALAFLFTLQHECTHATPFRTGWISTLVGVATGVVLVQPFHWFRAFHMAHHRFTNDPDRDPELQGDAQPETWVAFAWHLSTLGYWASKIRVLIALALGRTEDNFIPPKARRRITTEARAMIVIYAAVIVVSLTMTPLLLWVWLVPLALGFPVLRLYLLAEHGRCPAVTNMFENSRTTFTNRLVRFVAWNMPYHAEHHAYPSVPFHRLPDFHAHARPALRSTARGYRAFVKRYAKGLAPRA